MGQHTAEAALRTLRDAADGGEWNRCREAVQDLLQRLPAPRAWELTWQQVARRLPAFERHQPGITWPRDLLQTMKAADPSQQGRQGWPTNDDEFPGPGANNFITGVYELWRALSLAADDSRRIEALLDALSTAIMAEASEAWGSRYPERWAYWYESAGTGEPDPERFQVLFDCSRDPESVRIKREGWHEVADRLAEALGLPPER